MFYEVIPTEIFRSGGKVLTYSSTEKLQPGQLVLVPLGRKSVIGIVEKSVPAVDFPTKPITKVILDTPLPAHLVKAAHWLAEYYLSPLPSTASLLFPAGLLARGAIKAPAKQPAEPEIAEPSSQSAEPRAAAHRVADIPLNSAQKAAISELDAAPGPTKLLRGITGSGKTNIYLHYAAEALSANKSTILLVPEIALTSQLVQIFSSTFAEQVVVLHSGLTQSARRSNWLHILSSTKPLIIIGARSALFSPLKDLGLVIIDECHDASYFQDNSPHYSALRLASYIARELHITNLLGSATPSLIDYHLARSKHSLIELNEKAKKTALDPEVTLVSLGDRSNFTKNRYFSNQLLTRIEENLANHQQTLIFHNRRGSAPLTLCESCGWQALCPNCYLPLTLHSDTFSLSCHLCGHQENVPLSCPNCHNPSIIHKGFGTKLLESELQKLLTDASGDLRARIARFDGDNKKSEAFAELYDDVRAGEIDILIGTQTLARGLDLPHLATVGIIQADAGLHLPDFSAEERTFELLTQVIGRVGRGHLSSANVVLQSFEPDHIVIQTALRSDFPSFADYLLKSRRRGSLPPFTHLARLTITYKTESTTLAKIRQVHRNLLNNPSLLVSPPEPAFHEHTSRGFSWQLIIRARSRNSLVEALSPYLTPGFKASIILDPPSLL